MVIIDLPEAKIVGNTFLPFSKQLPRFCLPPLKGFFSEIRHKAGPSTLTCTKLPELQGTRKLSDVTHKAKMS